MTMLTRYLVIYMVRLWCLIIDYFIIVESNQSNKLFQYELWLVIFI